MHVWSEVSPHGFNGAYSQVSVYRISAHEFFNWEMTLLSPSVYISHDKSKCFGNMPCAQRNGQGAARSLLWTQQNKL